MRITYHLTQEALPRASHPKRPHHSPLPQVAVCVLLMVSRDRSSGDTEAWPVATEQVRQAVDLPTVTDPITVQRMCTKVRMVDGEQMKNRLPDARGGDDEDGAADHTGCSPGQAGRYDLTRIGRRSHRWATGVAAVGTQAQCIRAWRSGRGPGSNVPEVSGLRRDTRRDGRCRGRRTAWVTIAAAGIDGQPVRADDRVPLVRQGGIWCTPNTVREPISSLTPVGMARLGSIGSAIRCMR